MMWGVWQQQVRWGRWLLWLAALVLLAACNSGSGARAPISDNAPNPSPQLTLEEADQVAETFLQAWQQADYSTMYGLISPNSRDAFTPETFVETYQDIATTMVLSALDVHVTNSLRQGTTATVLYDVTFHSDLFGPIQDTSRLMQLVETPEGWRVAWSSQDIIAELANGARLDLVRQQPGRGNIYDRDGEVLADQNGRAVQLYVVQRDLADAELCITTLAPMLDQDVELLRSRFDLFAPDIRFVVGEVSPDVYQAQQQKLLDNCAIGDDDYDTGVRPTRRYFGTVASHIVGYVGPIQPEQLASYEALGYPPEAFIGQAGIERYYEDVLAGTIGNRLVVRSSTGQILRVLGEIPAEPGQSVYLTIDRDLQAAVQAAFDDAYAFAGPTWSNTSKGAAAVVLDVKTGEVLAMVSYPGYESDVLNPDSLLPDREARLDALRDDPRTPLLNRATRGLYPPGSVFKIVSMATGLDSGVYTLNTGWACSGRWAYGNDVRFDWLRSGHGWLDFKGALTNSCDPYFWQLGLTLHNEDPTLLEQYAYRMGLGVPSGQDAIEEEVGQIPDNELVFRYNGRSWTPADSFNLVIGQGEIQITPLQIARMVAAVANDGTLYKPLFVDKVQLIGNDPLYVATPEPNGSLDFAPGVLQAIREAMCDVTMTPTGTARYIFGEWYKFQATDIVVCGKTGTAQTGGALTKPQAWFAAFAPQDDPEIAIAVIVENSCEGSEVAAPIVRRIIEDYYGMPHYDWPGFWQSGCVSLGE